MLYVSIINAVGHVQRAALMLNAVFYLNLPTYCNSAVGFVQHIGVVVNTQLY